MCQYTGSVSKTQYLYLHSVPSYSCFSLLTCLLSAQLTFLQAWSLLSSSKKRATAIRQNQIVIAIREEVFFLP